MAIVDAVKSLFFAEIVHKRKSYKKSIDSRRAIRRGRRAKKTGYREPIFDNRAKSSKRVRGFQTEVIVKTIVTSEEKTGKYFETVDVRASGYFNITSNGNLVQGIG